MKACKRDALCKQCAALEQECGPRLFAHYSKKLLVRGWAGVMSNTERAYVRKHRSEAQQAQALAAGERLKAHGFAASTPSTDAGTA